jgi:hypothetical protein
MLLGPRRDDGRVAGTDNFHWAFPDQHLVITGRIDSSGQGTRLIKSEQLADAKAAFARRRERLVVILASDREALLAKAFTWIDHQTERGASDR